MKRSLLICLFAILISGCSNTLSKWSDVLTGRPVSEKSLIDESLVTDKTIPKPITSEKSLIGEPLVTDKTITKPITDDISTTKKEPTITWSNPLRYGNGLMAISNRRGGYGGYTYIVGETGTIITIDNHRGGWSFDKADTNVWLSDIWIEQDKYGGSIFICGYNGTIIEMKENILKTQTIRHNTNITNDFNAIWGSSDKSVFAVGDRGTIIHYDGTSWKLMDSGTDNLLFDIWGSADNDVYAAGGRGTLLHWDGLKWGKITIADDDIHITKLWGDSSKNIYAGGTGGKLFHYDGISWKSIDLPVNSLVRDIERLWTEEKIFVLVLLEPNIIAAYDGNGWITEKIGGAVYDGNGWVTEKIGGDDINLRDMLPAPPITVVGDGGVFLQGNISLKKEGKSFFFNWTPGSRSDITKIIEISGDFYTAGDKILRYQKKLLKAKFLTGEWFEDPNPLKGKIRSLYKNGNNMVVAGDGGEIALFKDNMWHKYPNADFDIYDIAEREGMLYIIGKKGHLAFYDEKASTWIAVDTKTDKDLKEIYAGDKGGIYIVGNGGTILKKDDSGVNAISSPVEEDLYDIDGDENANIYIAGAFGTLFRYSSGAWAKIETNTTATLRSIAIMKDRIVAGGDSGTILVKDSDGVKDFSNFTSNTIRDIAVKDNQSVFLAGDNGTILEMEW